MGFKFCLFLAALFTIFKLTNVVAWSWWWVLSPLWIPFATILVFIVSAFALAFIWGVDTGVQPNEKK